MTAPNHALTGALIGLSVAEPWVALPLALVSHLACDAIPHYDPAEQDIAKRISARSFIVQQLVLGAGLCGLVVLALIIARPHGWLTAGVCAFLATSPDMLWIPRFLSANRTGVDRPPTNWFLRFHQNIQWKTGPQWWWTEVLWAAGCVALLAGFLW